MEASEEGYVDADIENDEFLTSERLNEIFGIPPGTRFKDRSDFLSHIRFYGNDAETYHEAMRGIAAIGGPNRYQFEFRIVLPSGEVRWMWTRGVVTRDPGGRARRRIGVVADITGRKLAEEGLRRSEQRYALAMEAAADGHTDWNLVTGEFFISPRLLGILGYPPGTTFTDRADWVRRFPFHPEDRKRWEAAIAAHFASREAKFQMDLRIVVNGQTRWVAFTFIASRDPAGKPVRWTGTITDINDAKRDLATVLDAIPGMVALLTPASEVDVVNNELMAYLGKPLEEIKQWGTNGIVLPEDVPRAAAVLRQAVSTGQPYETELRIRRFDGVYRWSQTRGLPFRDSSGGIVRWYAMVSDIDERKRAEEGLRESQERYALAVAGATDGIWDWDLVTGKYYRSPRNQQITMGRPSDGVDTRLPEEWAQWFQLHPEDAPKRDAAIREHIEGRTPLYENEYRVLHQDGTCHWVQARGVCFRDASGRALRFAGSTSDIDARKAAEQALRASEERYALAVAGSDDGVWDVDFSAGRVFVSARARELIGVAPGPEMVPIDEFVARLPIHPEDAPRRRAAFEAHLAGETPAYFGEFRLLQPDGVYRWRRLRGLCVRDAAGKPSRMAGSISDIDARKRAEQALRLSEERYALALEASEEGHFDNDLETGEIFVSARLNEIYGFGRQPTVVNRMEFARRLPFHPEDRERVLAEMTRHERDGGAGDLYEIECRIVPRSGEMRWIHARAKVVRDTEGRARRRVGVVADITARKRAEEALKLSEKRYAVAMEVAEEGHFDWNVQTDEIFASAQALRVIGVPPERRCSTRADVMAHVRYHPDDWPRISAEWAAALAGRGTEHEFEYRILLGEEPRSIRGRWKIFRDETGAAMRVIGIIADITQRKRAEEARRLSEERYALAAAGTNDGIWDWDLLTNEMFVSERAQRIFGLEPGRTVRQRSEWHTLVKFHPDEVDAQLRMVDDYLAGRVPTNEGEWRVRQADGSYRWIGIRSICVRDASGRPTRMAGSVSDVDARKRAEEALRLSEERYALAMQASGEGHWDWKIAADEFYASPR